MTFHVRTLPKAESDIRSITKQIYKRSPQGAAAWVNAYERVRTHLAEFAEGSSEADENEFFDTEIRQRLFKTRRVRVYRLAFTTVGDKVRILRARGSAQAPIEPEDL